MGSEPSEEEAGGSEAAAAAAPTTPVASSRGGPQQEARPPAVAVPSAAPVLRPAGPRPPVTVARAATPMVPAPSKASEAERVADEVLPAPLAAVAKDTDEKEVSAGGQLLQTVMVGTGLLLWLAKGAQVEDADASL